MGSQKLDELSSDMIRFHDQLKRLLTVRWVDSYAVVDNGDGTTTTYTKEAYQSWLKYFRKKLSHQKP